ncbi:hypothetical protein L1987_48890 [Smallanthus sonchifolius]|uniref:Uncharacterized protein n=1 Tax=Smallanthus sonchifolius TaxID=185202 RepID=A0ACB9FSJ9_9ASTR|nr:hypothetical protein L1987_48890 [Smallanthus sonchifolius]
MISIVHPTRTTILSDCLLCDLYTGIAGCTCTIFRLFEALATSQKYFCYFNSSKVTCGVITKFEVVEIVNLHHHNLYVALHA